MKSNKKVGDKQVVRHIDQYALAALQQAYDQVVARSTALRGAIEALVTLSTELGGEPYAHGYSAVTAQALCSSCSFELHMALVRQAEREFAPPKGRLEIPSSETSDALDRYLHGRELPFRASALWAKLKRKYGGG